MQSQGHGPTDLGHSVVHVGACTPSVAPVTLLRLSFDALATASALIACTTTPAMTMDSASASSAAPSEGMAKMDAQMKNMREMHEKIMSAKTPEEHNKLMAEHMKAMQGRHEDDGRNVQL